MPGAFWTWKPLLQVQSSELDFHISLHVRNQTINKGHKMILQQASPEHELDLILALLSF